MSLNKSMLDYMNRHNRELYIWITQKSKDKVKIQIVNFVYKDLMYIFVSVYIIETLHANVATSALIDPIHTTSIIHPSYMYEQAIQLRRNHKRFRKV